MLERFKLNGLQILERRKTLNRAKRELIDIIIELFDLGVTSPAMIAAALENVITAQYVLQVLQDTGRHKPRKTLRHTLDGLSDDTVTRLRLVIESRTKRRALP